MLLCLQMHIVKNFLMDHGGFDTSIRVPLILGIWGAKGQGKSFQCELAFKKLGYAVWVRQHACAQKCIARACLLACVLHSRCVRYCCPVSRICTIA